MSSDIEANPRPTRRNVFVRRRKGGIVWRIGFYFAALLIAASLHGLGVGSMGSPDVSMDEPGFSSIESPARVLLAEHHENKSSNESECFSVTDFKSHNTGGWIVFCILVTLYIFLGLAIICDDYFVSSLELISDALHLSPDVAGATFMAAGSSAPELFTSLADSFFSQKEIGSGTIAGSAVFNLVVIPGLSAAVGGKALDLDWRPLARDSSFYFIAILLLTWFIMTDSRVDWWEALILFLTYIAYIVVMKFNEQIVARFCPRPYEEHTDESNPEGERRDSSGLPRRLSLKDMVQRLSKEGKSGVELEMSEMETEGGAASEEAKAEGEGGDDEEEEDEDKWACPAEPKAKIFWVLAMPYTVLFTFTVPDCAKERWKKWYFVSFFSSVTWIGVLTWVCVKMAEEIGCLAGIDPALMGIVLLAAGTSVPDTIASVLVAKEGQGDMAVSNAIGSNVFDILLGLGLPWLLSIAIFNKPVPGEGGLGTVVFAVLQLLFLLGLFLGLLWFNKFRLSPRLGYVLFAVYFVYVIVNIVYSVARK